MVRRLVRWCLAAALLGWSVAALSLVSLRWIDPPFTVVHIQRRVQAWIHKQPYHKRYTFVRLNRISPALQHAVIAGEDARFFQHHGFDWHEVRTAVEERWEEGRGRGASTITQQLVKNVFFGTGRSLLRKGAEFTLVPVAEFGLGKRRILELYLNVVEWGPGIYGIEAASGYPRTYASNGLVRPDRPNRHGHSKPPVLRSHAQERSSSGSPRIFGAGALQHEMRVESGRPSLLQWSEDHNLGQPRTPPSHPVYTKPEPASRAWRKRGPPRTPVRR